MENKKDINTQLQELVRYCPSVKQIIFANPWDHINNCDGNFTEDIFFNELFCETRLHKELSKNLLNIISSEIDDPRIIFINGFFGIGKTTFLHYFFKENKDPNKNKSISFIDFSSKKNKDDTDIIDFSTIRKDTNNPVVFVLKKYILEICVNDNGFKMQSVIAKIQNDPSAFKNYFKQFVNKILELNNLKVTQHDIINLLLDIDSTDLFILLFMLMFIEYEYESKFILCFDNIDNLDLQYLSETIHNEFLQSIRSATMLAQKEFKEKKINFSKTFVFLICMRDRKSVV